MPTTVTQNYKKYFDKRQYLIGLTLGVKSYFCPVLRLILKSLQWGETYSKTNNNQASIYSTQIAYLHFAVTRDIVVNLYPSKSYFFRTLSQIGLSENFPTPWLSDGLHSLISMASRTTRRDHCCQNQRFP